MGDIWFTYWSGGIRFGRSVVLATKATRLVVVRVVGIVACGNMFGYSTQRVALLKGPTERLESKACTHMRMYTIYYIVARPTAQLRVRPCLRCISATSYQYVGI